MSNYLAVMLIEPQHRHVIEIDRSARGYRSPWRSEDGYVKLVMCPKSAIDYGRGCMQEGGRPTELYRQLIPVVDDLPARLSQCSEVVCVSC